MMKASMRIILSCFVLLFTSVGLAAPKKVLIFYSSIGMGHLSAARAIEQNLKEEDPETVVKLYNIRDSFGSRISEKFDEWLFWKVVKTLPSQFDKIFQAKMKSANQIPQLQPNSSYSESKIEETINEFNPTHIVTTHYDSTISLIALRAKGKLRNIPVAWLHTDYFKGFFPRISKNIEMTFLGIDALMNQWEHEGIDKSRVVTTGLPVNTSVFKPVNKNDVLSAQGLDPNKKTIVLMSGGEGVGNFPEIINSIAESVHEPIQIIAVCAKNEKHFAALNAMKPNLPRDVDLRVHAFVKNDVVLDWIKASDIYITKSGGLSPTEGFAINKPIVLLDVYGGHERENANLFENLGLAIVNRNEKTIGKDIVRLMTDESLVKRMLKEQLKFRNSFNLNAINRFIFDAKAHRPEPMLNFGVENGTAVTNAEVELEKLESDSPSDIEIILSYGKSDTGKLFKGDANPFGHLALKIDGAVYTMNGRAKPESESLVFKTTLANYLYSVNREIENMEHTDSFGSAYARDNISIRVTGVTAEQKERMLNYFNEINVAFKNGKVAYNNTKFNCADLVRESLQSANLLTELKKKTLTMPLDVMDSFKDYFENDPKYQTEMIMYTKAPLSKNLFKGLMFPISIYQLKRSVKHMIFRKSLDPFEAQVTKRIYISSNDGKAYYENINGVSAEKASLDLKAQQSQFEKDYAQLESQELNLEKLGQDLKSKQMTGAALDAKFSNLISTFSAAQLSSMATGTIDSNAFPNEFSRAVAKAGANYLSEWEAAQKKYQDKMDTYIQTELNYLISATRVAMKSMMMDLAKRYPRKNSEKLNLSFNQAEQNYQMYIKNQDQYGKPKDGPLRTVPYRDFFFAAKEFVNQVEAIEGNSIENTSAWQKISIRFQKVSKFILAIAKMTPEILKVVLSTWFFSDDIGKNSLSSRTINAFKKASDVFNYKINIENRSIINNLVRQAEVNKKIVNLFVPNHSHPIYDGMLMSDLGLENPMIVAATDQIVGKPMADRVNEARTIITVGRGSNLPIQKIIAELGNNSSRNIIIYPEGSVSAGIYDTRPVRVKFSEGLVKALVDQGYSVNLIPITYKNTGRFLNENSILGSLRSAVEGTEKTTLEARVGQPLTSNFVQALIQSGRPGLLNLAIRSNWLENIDSQDGRIQGLLKVETLTAELRKKLKINLSQFGLEARKCERVFLPLAK